MTVRISTVLVLFLMLALGALAQTPSGVTPEMRSAANEAYQKQDWSAAADNYQKIVLLEPANAGARYRHGMSLLNMNRNESAQTSLVAAFGASPNPIFGLALARVYARLGKQDNMYEVLEKSITLGGIAAASLTGEADFSSLKNEPRFLDVVRRSDIAINPCKAGPEFRQFDFWIGEWDPKNAQGVTVGSSSIQLILGECVIMENWSTPVSSGKSFNIYNTVDKRWHQTWVDDKGTVAHYVGGLVEGRMVLDSVSVVNGKKTIARMTFSKQPNGDVRQHGEKSLDDGKTWTTTFDFAYVRKK